MNLAAAEDNDDNDDKKKKHRKRSGFNNARECPVLNAMEERCRDGSVVGFHEQLMPVCVAHELCYLCVSKARREGGMWGDITHI